MSTFVYMKILESAPNRYDQGIRWLTGGHLDEVYDRLTDRIQPGQKVLDIGCGTGSLTISAAFKGARVKGIDTNPQMLAMARKKNASLPKPVAVEWVEMGVTELDSEPADSYDVVMSGLCFSELSEDERSYGLHEIYRILKPNGFLLLADEAKSDRMLFRILNKLLKIPVVLMTYLLTQTTTRAIKQFPEMVQKRNFSLETVRWNRMQNFVTIVAKKQ